MTNLIQVKRSAVPGKIPTLVQLAAGELAVNTADEKLFFSSGTSIQEVLRAIEKGAANGVASLDGSGLLPRTQLPGLGLDDLTDVVITSPVAGQMLFFDGANWVNIGNADANGGGPIKRLWSGNVGASTGTTTITPGTTPPTSTAGTQIWTQTLTPLSTASRIVLQSSIAVAGSVNNSNLTLAVFRDTTYIGGTLQIVNSSTNSATLSCTLTDIPATVSPVTYQVRIGISSGAWYVNRRTNEVTYGGFKTGWTISEY